MRKLNVALCDDEVNTLTLLSGSLSALLEKRGVGAEVISCSSASQLRRWLAERRFNLIFLDIQMPGEDGIAVAAQLKEEDPTTQIVFVSSREDLVFDAIATQPFGFVRKRSYLADVVAVLDRFLAKWQRSETGGDTLVFQQKTGILRFRLEDVRYIEGSRKEQLLYTAGQHAPTAVHSTMGELEEQLAPKGFLRIHKGYLVNHSYIAAIHTSSVELTDGASLPLSRRVGQQVKEQYLAALRKDGALTL